MLIKSKLGQLPAVNKFVGLIVGIVILFLLAANLIPEAQTAGNTLNASDVPLGSLFASDGVVFVIIMAGIFIAVAGAAFYKGRR